MRTGREPRSLPTYAVRVSDECVVLPLIRLPLWYTKSVSQTTTTHGRHRKMQLKNTDKNLTKLVAMARECNDYNGTHDWVEAYSFDEIDEILGDMKPSDILEKVFFGDIDEEADWGTARIRFDAYENIEITSEYQIEQEAWDNRDEILEDYKDVVSEPEYEQAMEELDFED